MALLDALVTAWPLVGRDALVARVLAALEGGSRGVVLAGAAGVGKSRVARVVVASLTRDGRDTEWVQATDATRDLPLGAFGPILPKAARAGHRRRPPPRSGLGDARPPGRRVRPRVRAGNGPHWRRHARRDRVALEGRVRRAHRRRTAVGGRGRRGAPRRARRRGRGGDGAPPLVGDPRQRPVRPRAGARRSPLGRAEPRNDLWTWRGSLDGDGKLRDVLEARLAPLGPRERAALVLLAVGEPLGIDVFERMVGIDVVDDLERQELIRIRRDERREEASLAHPLYRDLLRGGMSDDDVAEAREQLAEGVEAAGGRRRGDVLRVALWRLGGPAEARADLLIAAATEAESRFDAELAERLARAAVDRGGASPAWHAVATALRAQGRNREADEAWATALDLETDPAGRIELAQSRSANLFFGLGEGSRAIGVLDSVIADATTQALRDNIASLVGMFDLYRGRIDTAIAAAVPILDRGSVRSDARIDAALTASAAYALRGQPADAIAVVDANIASALQDPTVGSIAAGALMATRLLALALDGRLQEAMQAARVVYDLAVEMGTHDGIAGLSFAIGHVYQALGNVDAARRHLLEGAGLLREHDRNGYLPWCLGELAYAHLLAGNLEDARATVDELREVSRPEMRLFQPRVDTARLVLAVVEGVDGAIDELVDTAQQAVDDGHLVLGAMALHEAVRLGAPELVADRLSRIAVATDSGLVRAYAASARAGVARDGAALDIVAGAFESMGALLLAAEGSAAAAEAHRDAGANAARAAATQRAASLLARCPGAAPPWLDIDTEPEPLSGRQLEVARMAAAGLSSREIAERLFLSVRTVDNHLYRIYAKLGVENREELAVVLLLTPGPDGE